MGLELIYTSARKGLKPGSIGFCTVAMSRQLSPSLAAALESLSGYRHLFMAGHASYAQNPVNFCHYLVPDRGRLVRVIARIGSAPPTIPGAPTNWPISWYWMPPNWPPPVRPGYCKDQAS